MAQYKGKRYGASTPKARVRQTDEGGRPVSIFTDQNRKNVPPPEQFRSERQYRNALARAAGYENYDSWLRARGQAGVQQPWNIGQSLRNKSEEERTTYRDEVRQRNELNRETRRARERAYRETHREAYRIKRAQAFNPERIAGRHADQLRGNLTRQLTELNDMYAYDRQSLRDYLQDAPSSGYATMSGWKRGIYRDMGEVGLTPDEYETMVQHNRITSRWMERQLITHVAAGTMTPEEGSDLIAALRMVPSLTRYIEDGHNALPGSPERIRMQKTQEFMKDLWRRMTGGGFIPEDFKEYSGGIYYH